MKVLLITLGHNASAIFVNDKEVIGYEQERLDKIKSSSSFPSDSVMEIIKNVGIEKIRGSNVFISHWYDNIPLTGELKNVDDVVLNSLKDIDCTIISNDLDFTHHDAHAWSSYAFFRKKINKKHLNILNNDELFFIVADGFGNNQEVISIYSTSIKDLLVRKKYLKLIKRVKGYENSLGLMYQYATSYVGMKENQDEYKFLGYESKIDEIYDKGTINDILEYAYDYIENTFIKNYINSNNYKITLSNDGYINLDELSIVKSNWYDIFDKLLLITRENKYSENFKVAIAFFIQNIVEKALKYILEYHKIDNVVLSGGLFYNVKLNNSILKNVDGLLSVNPLSGDQGAAIGYFEKYIGNFNFDNLFWGKRDLSRIKKITKNKENIFVFDNLNNSVLNKIADEICCGNIVNLVYSNMEFGPRALCHTSSLFLPTKNNTVINNFINKRNEVMPCAPVIKHENIGFFFDEKQYSRVVGSDEYMIITYDYNFNYSKQYSGVMHKYPLIEKYSGRPQIIYDSNFMHKLLTEVEKRTGCKCLVNTSYNVHGKPIVFNINDILSNFNFQLDNKQSIKPKLFVILDE